METSEKIAVVTGAGSGIGRASALALVGAGFAVVLAGRRHNMLEETAALAETAAGNASRTRVVPTDVSDPAAIAALFDAVKTGYGRLDLLFNNAGISTRGVAFEDLTFEQWSNVVAVNLTGSFLCAQHAFRIMKGQDPQGGRSSTTARSPPTCRAVTPPPMLRPSMRSLGSPDRCPSTGVNTISPVARSISATPPPPATRIPRKADCRQPEEWKPSPGWMSSTSRGRSFTWLPCRSRPMSSS